MAHHGCGLWALLKPSRRSINNMEISPPSPQEVSAKLPSPSIPSAAALDFTSPKDPLKDYWAAYEIRYLESDSEEDDYAEIIPLPRLPVIRRMPSVGRSLPSSGVFPLCAVNSKSTEESLRAEQAKSTEYLSLPEVSVRSEYHPAPTTKYLSLPEVSVRSEYLPAPDVSVYSTDRDPNVICTVKSILLKEINESSSPLSDISSPATPGLQDVMSWTGLSATESEAISPGVEGPIVLGNSLKPVNSAGRPSLPATPYSAPSFRAPLSPSEYSASGDSCRKIELKSCAQPVLDDMNFSEDSSPSVLSYGPGSNSPSEFSPAVYEGISEASVGSAADDFPKPETASHVLSAETFLTDVASPDKRFPLHGAPSKCKFADWYTAVPPSLQLDAGRWCYDRVIREDSFKGEFALDDYLGLMDSAKVDSESYRAGLAKKALAARKRAAAASP